MGDFVIPLLLLQLVALAAVARVVFQPRIFRPLTWLTVLAVSVYLVVAEFPWSNRSPVDSVRIPPTTRDAMGGIPDATARTTRTPAAPTSRLPSEQDTESETAGERSAEPLGLRRMAGGRKVVVLRGNQVIGELSPQALAELRQPSQPERPKEDDAERAAASDAESARSIRAARIPEPAAPEPPATRAPASPVSKPSAPEPLTAARAPAARPRPASPASLGSSPDSSRGANDEDREVELRTRASLLAVNRVCRAAQLLQSGQQPRTRALARELSERCEWTSH